MLFSFTYILKSGIELKDFTNVKVTEEEDLIEVVKQMFGDSDFSTPIISNGAEFVKSSEIAYIKTRKENDEEIYEEHDDLVDLTPEMLEEILEQQKVKKKSKKGKKK